jgi:hypothetical protein
MFLPVVCEMSGVDCFIVVLAGPAVLAGADEDVGQQVDNIIALQIKITQFAFL